MFNEQMWSGRGRRWCKGGKDRGVLVRRIQTKWEQKSGNMFGSVGIQTGLNDRDSSRYHCLRSRMIL